MKVYPVPKVRYLYPHPFTKRLDAAVLSRGQTHWWCEQDWQVDMVRGRIAAAARRGTPLSITTRFDAGSRILTVSAA